MCLCQPGMNAASFWTERTSTPSQEGKFLTKASFIVTMEAMKPAFESPMCKSTGAMSCTWDKFSRAHSLSAIKFKLSLTRFQAFPFPFRYWPHCLRAYNFAGLSLYHKTFFFSGYYFPFKKLPEITNLSLFVHCAGRLYI